MGKLLRVLVVGLVLLSTKVVWGQCVDLTLTPASLPGGQQGAVYAGATFGALGATLPVTFTTASVLPTGMTLSGGMLAGMPTQSGTFGVRVVATDAEGCLASILLPLVIAPGTVPTITSGTSTAFTVGQADSFTVTTTGVPTPTLAQGGDALPSGVTFTDNTDGTGTLSGPAASGTGGTYNLTFTATNGNGSSPVQTFTLTVNETPSVSGGPFTIAENSANGTVVGTATVTDPHTPAQTHTWAITAGNTGSAFAIDSSGQITVATSSALDFETTPSFSLTVQATDNGTPALSGSATITVNVTNVNEGPTATPDSTTVAEGGTVTTLTTPAGATSVRENDSDPDNLLTDLVVTTTPVSAPTNGSLTLNADGTFSYTHDGSETTTDSFIYEICDPQPLCDTATVFITITAGNDAPVLTAGATLNYTENQAATAIDTTITVADIDDANLEGATVQITGNYQTGQDVLAFPDTATITGPFTAATGLLTLSGSDTLANYQAALRSVTYQNTSDTPNTTNRTVTWVGNDGTTNSAAVTSTITVAATNDPPVLTAGATLAYTEGNPATALDTTITVVDADDVNLESAGVQITGNYQNGADVLAFANTATITGTFTAATGLLTLTGSDSLANYQVALRSVTYQNTSANPSIAARTVTWLGNDGTDTSVPVTSTITVTAVNDAPVLTAGATLAYTENQLAQAIDTTITVVDADDVNLESATVQITTNYQTGEDVLACGTCGGITASFIAATGTLSLSGSATLAAYQTALRSVTYVNASDTPNITNRTVTWIGNDGTDVSASVTSTITVTAANDPPVLTAGGTLSYTENQAAQVVNGTVTVTDPDDTNLESATVQITSNYQNGSDVLACPSGCSGIGAVFTPATGTLTLTGTASEAAYQAALRSVTYVNTSENPTTASRTVTWLGNDGTDTSVAVTSTITVTAVNDAPVLTAGGTLGYTENQAATAINTTVTVSDVDSTNLVGATLQITGNYQNGQDVLSFTNTATITGSFAAASGTLTLAGTDTLANYQAALRSVRYANSSENPNTTNRTVTWQVNDGGGVNNLSNTPTSTITVTAVNDPPSIASPPSYGVHTNIAMDVADGAGDLLDVGITDVDSAGPFTLGSVPSTAAVTGGTLTSAANGSFHYNPGPNLTGAGTFVYQICDSGTPGVACTNVTATLNVSGLAIVFVDDSAAGGGNGTLEQPVQTLAAGLTALGAGGGASNLFLLSGNYGQTAVQTLANNVRIFGQGSGVADFETLYAITPPETAPVNSIDRPALSQTRPVVSSTTGCLALALGGSNTLRGFEIGSCAGDALASTGANFGTLTVPNDNMVINTSGRALNLTNGTLTATFSSITSTGGANNINLNTIAGTATLGSGALSGATGTAFNAATGTGVISYSGSITNTAAARLVNIVNKSGTGGVTLSGNLSGTGSSTGINVQNNTTTGTIAFTGGSKVLTTGANPAITLDNNDSATLNFSGGGLVITTTSGAGFNAINGATAINVSGAGNTITSTTGTALNVTNSTIGGLGLTFQSISANGPATGITLNTTGSGAFTVSGTGTTAGSGGTIQNATSRGAEFISSSNITLRNMNFTNNGVGGNDLNCGDALGASINPSFVTSAACESNIHLQSVTTVVLDNVSANDGDAHGINGVAVNGLTLTNVQVLRNGTMVGEDGVQLVNLTGTVNVTGGTFRDNASRSFEVQNNSGTPTITIAGAFFGNTNFPTAGGTAPSPANSTAASTVLLATNGTNSASITSTTRNSTFQNVYSIAFHVDMAGNTSQNVTFGQTGQGNTITTASQGITIVGTNSGGLTASIVDNTLNNDETLMDTTASTNINFRRGGGLTPASGNWNVTIDNNDVGINGNAFSGCETAGCSGISADDQGSPSGTYTVLIQNNTVYRVSGPGIQVGSANAGAHTVNATVINNTVGDPEANAQGAGGQTQAAGIFVFDGTDTTSTTNARIANNVVTGLWDTAGALGLIRVRHGNAGATMNLCGYSGTTVAQVNAFLAAQNPGTLDPDGAGPYAIATSTNPIGDPILNGCPP